jgi:branched-chain amino acid transport system substrate-binding protein
VPTARHWFGYVSAMSFALVANREKTVEATKLAAALENFELPDDVKLQPNKVYYRKGDHQLMTSAFVGEAQSNGKDDPEDLFRVDEVIPGDKTAPAVSDTGCNVQWPS